MNATVIPPGWYTSDQTEKALNIAERTLQEWAKKGFLKYRTVSQGRHRVRLYAAADVERLQESGPPRGKRTPRDHEAISHVKLQPPSHAARQEARALDTVSIVGQMLAAWKSDRDAEREREKARREDERELRESELRRAEERARPWLTLQQAIDVSGLTAAAIRRAVKEEKLVAMKAGGLRISRASLETL